uniref:hypothetical protein n=1 Tax=uncultured Cyclobacterium sp. TaxID=453820 RepID=UPI0030EB6066
MKIPSNYLDRSDALDVLGSKVFPLSWVLRTSILFSISLSISKDRFKERSPFGILESSKLFGMFFLRIMDVETVKKQQPKIVKKFEFHFDLVNLMIRQKLFQLHSSYALAGFEKIQIEVIIKVNFPLGTRSFDLVDEIGGYSIKLFNVMKGSHVNILKGKRTVGGMVMDYLSVFKLKQIFWRYVNLVLMTRKSKYLATVFKNIKVLIFFKPNLTNGLLNRFYSI